MRILVAPDKFKGSLSAREVAENIALGLRDVLPESKIDIVPMADGGEGTTDVICDALNGSWRSCKAHDALGREIEARYAWIEKEKLAVMEMSEAAGMRRLKPNERDVDLADTFGVGEMILDAGKCGAQKIIVGLGGSATNDGGVGMARAIGFRFDYGHEHEHENENENENGRRRVSALVGLRGIAKPKDLILPEVVAVADVRNPLLGENGATRIFGPQKGADPDRVVLLERALTRLADVVARDLGFDYRAEPGAGAAGGLGFGLMSFCDANIQPGFDAVARIVRLEEKIQNSDVVITGEGSLDRQTLEGKTPAGVASIARELGKPVYAIVGRADEDRQVREIFDGVYELGGSIPEARELLRKSAGKLAGIL